MGLHLKGDNLAGFGEFRQQLAEGGPDGRKSAVKQNQRLSSKELYGTGMSAYRRLPPNGESQPPSGARLAGAIC